MAWIKAFHLIFVVTWFAGLFYLPRLFVYHAQTEDRAGHERFLVMERKLMMITNIGAVLALGLGLWLLARWMMLSPGYMAQGWLHTKLFLVLLLIGYHGWCQMLVRGFRLERNTHSHVWYRWFNEVPVVLLIGIVILAVVKPF